MKKQVIVIHGGETFDSYDEYLASLENYEVDFERMNQKGWKDKLGERLGAGWEVFAPSMPNKINAKYLEWKIWFDKLVPFFEDEVVLVGHSLGGIFLAKYLSENSFKKRIRAVFLVAPPYDALSPGESLADFILPESLAGLEVQSPNTFIYHSEDDPVVPVINFEKYKQALPKAKAILLTDRGHFSGEEFPEFVEEIKKLM